MKRYYGHRITKRERAAINKLYAPNSAQPGIHGQEKPSDQLRGFHTPLFTGAADRKPRNSAARAINAAGKSTPQTARKD